MEGRQPLRNGGLVVSATCIAVERGYGRDNGGVMEARAGRGWRSDAGARGMEGCATDGHGMREGSRGGVLSPLWGPLVSGVGG